MASDRPGEVHIERWHASVPCCDPVWEEAYRRSESPEEEVEKFRKRLLSLGAADWPAEAEIAELCCGRGSGLKALAALGFRRLNGVDLSEDLLRSYSGPARLFLGDCRDLQFPARSLDVVIVQGGLHHLPDALPDLERTLRGVRRALRPEGRLVVVEPWRTPILSLFLVASRMRLVRRAWDRLDAMATMVEREHETYFRWLSLPEPILAALRAHFVPQHERVACGRLLFVGTPRSD